MLEEIDYESTTIQPLDIGLMECIMGEEALNKSYMSIQARLYSVSDTTEISK